MEQISVRLVALLLIGILVIVLTLYAPEAGSAVLGAVEVMAVLAQLTTRE
ncbi:hypothetical protein AB0D67_31105 [Streptosporangium sp. NPDC048047]